jgi:hypothetical protein
LLPQTYTKMAVKKKVPPNMARSQTVISGVAFLSQSIY